MACRETPSVSRFAPATSPSRVATEGGNSRDRWIGVPFASLTKWRGQRAALTIDAEHADGGGSRGPTLIVITNPRANTEHVAIGVAEVEFADAPGFVGR